MRHKADSEKKEEALASRTMASIEEQAQKQYEKDLEDAEASASSIGDWVRDLAIKSSLSVVAWVTSML